MNCFQKLVSLIFWTTNDFDTLFFLLLWIAFKNLYLWYSEQLDKSLTLFNRCCELLSKTCIFDILNNSYSRWSACYLVVNCFQKLVSLIFWTTHEHGGGMLHPLWIAFKNLYLWYSEQQLRRMLLFTRGCELLSKTCIFDILNNKNI